MIKIQDLFFSYENEQILSYINLDIGEKKVTGILGENGAGKSTLIKCIGGYLKFNQGKIFINGNEINKMKIKDIAKEVSYVPQNFEFNYDFKVIDIVVMARYAHKKSNFDYCDEDYEVAKDAISKAGISHLSNRSVMMLSGGEKQKVIIARCIAQKAKVILLDEPVSNLDMKSTAETLEIMKKMSINEGITIICVLHDINAALNFCDDVVFIKDHKVFDFGNTKEKINMQNIKNVYGIDSEILEKENRSYFLQKYNSKIM